jgi:hypothetical protein
MTLAVVLLVMMAGGIFWYWHSLPKQAPAKKTAPADNAQKRTSVKKSAPAKAPAHSTDNHDAAARYRAVSIQCRDNGCAAAKALAGKRLLTATAPTLPVPGCDAANCQCSYSHHGDRRAEDDDRRSVHGLRTELYTRTAGEERRERRGRRKDDMS